MTTVTVSSAWRAARSERTVARRRQRRQVILVVLIGLLAKVLPQPRTVLRLAGVGALVTAAWIGLGLALGLTALGLALLLLEWVGDRK